MKFLFYILFFTAVAANAQTVNYSLPEKISNKNYDYAILGKTTEGILIYKFNKYENIVSCYDEMMNKKWERTAQLSNKSSTIQHISIHKNELFVFFSYDKGNYTIFAAQCFSNKLEPNTKFVKIDSVYHEKWSSEINFFVLYNENKSTYMVYYFTGGGTEVTNIHATVFAENFNVVKTNDLSLPVGQSQLFDEQMDNNGNVYFITGTPGDKQNSTNKTWTNPVVYKYALGKNDAVKGILLCHKQFNSMMAKIDNINNDLVIGGMYSNSGSTDIAGYGLVKMRLKDDSISIKHFEPFTDKQTKEMKMAMDADVNNYETTDLIVRFDGGVIITAENNYFTTQTVEIPNYYSPSFPTVKTYTYLHYDDMAMAGLAADGSFIWHSILRKKQTSENDDGYYSSYGLVKGKEKLSLIYNEEISDQTNLMAYAVTQDGKTTRGSVCNSKQKNIFLSPRKARQVSLYELVIPSEYRGYLQFVKIDF